MSNVQKSPVQIGRYVTGFLLSRFFPMLLNDKYFEPKRALETSNILESKNLKFVLRGR